MNSIPFPTFDMSEAQAQSLLHIFTNLKNIYTVEVDPDFSLDIKRFDVFANNELVDYDPAFKIVTKNNPFYLNYIRITYPTGGRYSQTTAVEYQTLGIIELKNNFGHILIRPETFLDKVYNIINPIDVDFEDDKEFSEKFLVVSNDKLKAQLQMKTNFRDYIKEIDLKEFVIEIIDNKLIIGDRKVATLESSIQFANFMNKISGSLI